MVKNFETREKMEKVTMLLPKDTVQKIDSMAEEALFGSRGRTVQALVDSVIESSNDMEIITRVFQEMSKSKDVQTSYIQLIMTGMNMANIIRRLNTFLGIDFTKSQG